MSDETSTKVGALLQQVSEIHHMVFADTDGNDDDWASFYSDWLLAHSPLADAAREASGSQSPHARSRRTRRAVRCVVTKRSVAGVVRNALDREIRLADRSSI